jgi:hypothetical protein
MPSSEAEQYSPSAQFESVVQALDVDVSLPHEETSRQPRRRASAQPRKGAFISSL